MNRRVLGLAVLLIAIFLTFRFCSSNDKQKVDEKPTPLSVAVHSGAFNQSFSSLLESYYALKDAFVASNAAQVNSAADRLMEKATSLQGRTQGRHFWHYPGNGKDVCHYYE